MHGRGRVIETTLGIYDGIYYAAWDTVELPDGRQVVNERTMLYPHEGPRERDVWTGRPLDERRN